MVKDIQRILWFCAGAAVGAGVALLYAPQSGKETRKHIRKRAEKAREALVETGEDLVERGKAIYKKGVKVADGAVDLLERGRRLVTG